MRLVSALGSQGFSPEFPKLFHSFCVLNQDHALHLVVVSLVAFNPEQFLPLFYFGLWARPQDQAGLPGGSFLCPFWGARHVDLSPDC